MDDNLLSWSYVGTARVTISLANTCLLNNYRVQRENIYESNPWSFVINYKKRENFRINLLIMITNGIVYTRKLIIIFIIIIVIIVNANEYSC